MFDNIGRDLDDEARKRSATSMFATVTGLGASVAFVVGVGAYTTARIVADTESEVPLVQMIEEAPPELHPPPPPGPADPQRPDQADDPEPDPLPDEFQELSPEVDDTLEHDAQPAGAVGGVAGGNGGGTVGGIVGGTGRGDAPFFSPHSLVVKKRTPLDYPEAARTLNLGDQRCLVTVVIDQEGVPQDAAVEGCPKAFHEAARQGILGWRWYPPRVGREKVRAQTMIAVIYKLD